MPTKIIISADEVIICPKDHHKFPLHQGITRQTMDKYEKEFEKELEKRGIELQEEIEKEVRRKISKEYSAKKIELEDKLAEKEEELSKTKSQITKIQKEAKAKALAEFEQEKKIKNEISKKESEKSKFKIAEIEKKLGDALRLNEDITRKLEQGSQQLQGEVLEIEVEELLRSSFPHDLIEAVRKGARGADVIHKVHTPTGQFCGTKIGRAKRAESWSDKWVQKLKDDQMEAGAEVAVIVSTTLPKASKEPFILYGNVWITNTTTVRPIAEALRAMLIENSKLKLT